MPKLPDYYKILEVHPEASHEVIQNAYRTLAKKFHPDVYSDKNIATKTMILLNEAYAVLSDPQKRKAYDNELIGFNIQSDHHDKVYTDGNNQQTTSFEYQVFTAQHIAKQNNEILLNNSKITLFTFNGIGLKFYGQEDFDSNSNSYITQYWLSFLYLPIFPLGKYRVIKKENSYLIISKAFRKSIKNILLMFLKQPASIIVWGLIIFFSSTSITPEQSSQPAQSLTQSKESAPDANTSQLPKTNVITEYTKDTPYLNSDGYCELTIDNSQNNEPVYVRVWSLPDFKPVRTFTIRQKEHFTVKSLSPGQYEIRYKYLYENAENSYGAKTEPLLLSQRDTPTGVEYETIRLTLYKVKNGNMRTFSIPASEI